MFARKMFDTPITPRLENILSEVLAGDLAIPDFQRPFVWSDEQRLNLLDSIVKGLPIGSLLVWRTTNKELKTYSSLGGVPLPSPSRGSEKVSYVIDGHQRLSTLFGALYGVSSEGATPGRWHLYYELGAGAERPAFRLPPPRGHVPPNWLPTHFLLNHGEMWDFQGQLRNQGLEKEANEALRISTIFRDYVIPIVPLVSDDLNLVTDAFVRVNSQGKGMTEAHMLRALTYSKDADTDSAFREIRQRLEPLGWQGLESSVLVSTLKAMLGLDVYAAGVREVHEHLENGPDLLQRLNEAVLQAVTFLCSMGVHGPEALPYAYQLVLLATVADKVPQCYQDPRRCRWLETWFWQVSYGERFTGITGSGIRAELDSVMATVRLPETEIETRLKAIPTLSLNALTQFRTNSVRTRAFLLCLTRLPTATERQKQRQLQLCSCVLQGVPKLFVRHQGNDPANRVIASQSELLVLRDALKARAWSSDLQDEFAIPEHAVEALPDIGAFFARRRAWLHKQEAAFVKTFHIVLETEATLFPGGATSEAADGAEDDE